MALDGVLGGGSSIVTIHIHGLDKAMRTFDPKRFRQFFNKHMNLGLRRFAYQMMRNIMKEIHRGNYGEKGKLGIQRFIKGSDKILVNTGDLMSHAIGWKFLKEDAGTTIGMRFSPRDGVHGPSGLTYQKLITLLSEGTSFTPTLAQRVALKKKAEAGAKKPDPPVGAPKQTWVIPPRPFLSQALHNSNTISSFKRVVNTALRETIRDLQK